MHYAKDQMSVNGQDTIGKNICQPLKNGKRLTTYSLLFSVAKSPECDLIDFVSWNTYMPYLSQGDINLIQAQYGQFC